jgi:hypothetical protein
MGSSRVNEIAVINNEVLCLGHISLDTNTDPKPFLTTVSAVDGSILSSISDFPMAAFPKEMNVLNDDSILIIMEIPDETGIEAETQIIKLNSNGDEVFNKIYDFCPGNLRIYEEESFSFLLVIQHFCNTSSAANDNDLRFIKYDRNGNN